MSAGSFKIGVYVSDAGVSYPVRIQPETNDLTIGGQANPDGAVAPAANTPTLTVRKSRRSRGLIPRTVTVRLTADGTGATGDYQGEGTLHTVPVLTAAAWDAMGPAGTAGTYLGIACEFVSKNPELVR